MTPPILDLQTNVEARQKLESQQQENKSVQNVQFPSLISNLVYPIVIP